MAMTADENAFPVLSGTALSDRGIGVAGQYAEAEVVGRVSKEQPPALGIGSGFIW